jgi:hypothetical protein
MSERKQVSYVEMAWLFAALMIIVAILVWTGCLPVGALGASWK